MEESASDSTNSAYSKMERCGGHGEMERQDGYKDRAQDLKSLLGNTMRAEFYVFIFLFLRPHSQNMEVAGPGTESTSQLC